MRHKARFTAVLEILLGLVTASITWAQTQPKPAAKAKTEASDCNKNRDLLLASDTVTVVARPLKGEIISDAHYEGNGLVSGTTQAKFYDSTLARSTRIIVRHPVCFVLMTADGKVHTVDELEKISKAKFASDGETTTTPSLSTVAEVRQSSIASAKVVLPPDEAKQDTAKKPAKKPAAKSTPNKKTAAKPKTAGDTTKFLVLPAQSVDTTKSNHDARREQFVKDSIANAPLAERVKEDSLKEAALKNAASKALSDAASERHARQLLQDSLQRIQKAQRDSARSGPTSSRNLRIGKEGNQSRAGVATPTRAVPQVDTVPVFHTDTLHETVYKTDTLRVPGPTITEVKTFRDTVHDSGTAPAVHKGHNPWPWIFGIAVVGGATTYLICHNGDNCRPPDSHASSCSTVVVNGTLTTPPCPAPSKSRWLMVGTSIHF